MTSGGGEDDDSEDVEDMSSVSSSSVSMSGCAVSLSLLGEDGSTETGTLHTELEECCGSRKEFTECEWSLGGGLAVGMEV